VLQTAQVRRCEGIRLSCILVCSYGEPLSPDARRAEDEVLTLLDPLLNLSRMRALVLMRR
jgi:hypothetical protein